MGRSVSYPSGATVAFMDLSDDEGEIDFDYYREWAREVAQEFWPSMWEEDREWRGREDKVLCRNRLVDFGWSEYCGLAAFWMIPRGDLETAGQEALAEHWIKTVEPRFRKTFGTLRKIGTFSNGEGVYERVAA